MVKVGGRIDSATEVTFSFPLCFPRPQRGRAGITITYLTVPGDIPLTENSTDMMPGELALPSHCRRVLSDAMQQTYAFVGVTLIFSLIWLFIQ